jgi:hypothetical protein
MILWIGACSVLRILPLSGKIAWNDESRPCLALPHALDPSTMNSSDQALSLLEQSANLPGKTPPAKTFFLRTVSLANFAASLALALSMILSNKE